MIAWLLAAVAFASPVHGRIAIFGTGEPIAGAEVDFSQQDALASAVTDATGHFTVDLPDGTWSVKALADGYLPRTAEVAAPTDQPVELFLKEEVPYVVVVQAFDPSPSISKQTVDAEQTRETPGTYEDSVRLVQSLAGVAVQREYSPSAGELAIRGGSGVDNRYYLDGIELPYLYHYNQYASVFPTSQIDTLDLYSSTYGADYGDAVGAIIDVQSKTRTPKRVHGSANLNFVMAGADVTAPVGRKGWWVSAAGRRSFLDFASKGSDQYTLWPIFDDFALRAGHNTKKTDTQVFAWGAGDRYDRYAGEIDLLDPVEASQSPSFSYHRGFEVVGAAHQWKDRHARFVGAVVDDRLRGDLSGGGGERLRTLYLTSRYDDDFRLPGRLEILAGGELRAERTWLDVNAIGRTGLLVAEEAPALARGVSVNDAMWRARAGIYGQLRWRPGPFTIMPGIRLATDTAGQALLAEPRLALRWRLADQSALKLAGGLYHQAPATEHLFPGTGKPDLPTTASWQVAGGWEQTVANRLEFDLESYYMWLDDTLFYPIDGPAVVAGGGRAWGVELTTRYRLLKVFFLRGWIGYGRSMVDHPRYGWIPSDGDQPVGGGVVASWDLTPTWNVAARYRFGSGLPYTDLVDGLYDATSDTWIPVPGPENGARYPFYQRVDVHASHKWVFRRWEMALSGDVWIVPKSSAQLYPTWNYDYTQQGWVVGPTLFPVLGLNVKF